METLGRDNAFNFSYLLAAPSFLRTAIPKEAVNFLFTILKNSSNSLLLIEEF